LAKFIPGIETGAGKIEIGRQQSPQWPGKAPQLPLHTLIEVLENLGVSTRMVTCCSLMHLKTASAFKVSR